MVSYDELMSFLFTVLKGFWRHHHPQRRRRHRRHRQDRR